MHLLTYISSFLLDPVSTQVLILTPLSAVPTLFAPTYLEHVAVRVWAPTQPHRDPIKTNICGVIGPVDITHLL